MNPSIYIALDFKTKNEALDFLDEHQLNEAPVKVGMQLFYREGPIFIQELKKRGHSIFLDLKLHDIPNTVYKAMKSLAHQNVDIVNVHASGGLDMMKAAKRGLEEGNATKVPLLLAVTQLTSTDDDMLLNELLIKEPMEQVVHSYAALAKRAGVNGVVCSVAESKLIKQLCGTEFVTVTPGIRLKHDHADDQKRIATPSQASFSDHLVMGRSITQSKNPKAAYERALKEWNHEYSETTN